MKYLEHGNIALIEVDDGGENYTMERHGVFDAIFVGGYHSMMLGKKISRMSRYELPITDFKVIGY